MERVLRFLVLLLAAVQPLGGVEQRFAMEPQDQTAIVGSRVTLPCRVINKTGVLQWTKDDFGLGTHRNLSGFDRYSMIGSDEEGQSMMWLSLLSHLRYRTPPPSKEPNRLPGGFIVSG
jgi:hypothetical protein